MPKYIIPKTLFAVPNLLTYARILMIPLIFWLIFRRTYGHSHIIAFGLFVAASITDYFDGYLSRKWKLVSELGKFLDPIADKLLVTAVLMALAATKLGAYVTAIATVIVMREIFVSGLREYLGNAQVQMPVSRLAKWKTASQFVAVGLLIFGFPLHGGGDLYSQLMALAYDAGAVLLAVSATLTVITGMQYLRIAFRHMRD
jgi:CDP-diacylglycerol--glycerol-3-phosphate 3-phosphatidyltransferase